MFMYLSRKIFVCEQFWSNKYWYQMWYILLFSTQRSGETTGFLSENSKHSSRRMFSQGNKRPALLLSSPRVIRAQREGRRPSVAGSQVQGFVERRRGGRSGGGGGGHAALCKHYSSSPPVACLHWHARGHVKGFCGELSERRWRCR